MCTVPQATPLLRALLIANGEVILDCRFLNFDWRNAETDPTSKQVNRARVGQSAIGICSAMT